MIRWERKKFPADGVNKEGGAFMRGEASSFEECP